MMTSSKRTNGANDRKPGCPIPLQSGCLRGLPLPTSIEEGIKMECSYAQCPYQDQYIHPECFHALEDNLVKIMSNLGSARGWTDAQRRSNLWDKKGLSLIQRKCRCPCGLGLMRLDQTAMFLASRNSTAIAPPKAKKGRKNLPRLNFGNGPANPCIISSTIDKQQNKYGNLKKSRIVRSASPTDESSISASSYTINLSHCSERRVLSHTCRRGKWNSNSKNTKSERGWMFKKPTASTVIVEQKVRKLGGFSSKKVIGNVSYAEAALLKHDTEECMFSESEFPRANEVESQLAAHSLSLCTEFGDINIGNFNASRNFLGKFDGSISFSGGFDASTSLPGNSDEQLSFPSLLDSLQISTNASLPYDDLSNSLLNSISSDDTFDFSSYYHFDTTGFFVRPIDLPSNTPPSTSFGSSSFTDDSQTTSQNEEVSNGVAEEPKRYYDLFSGASFCLGELLIAQRYLPGLF